MLSCLALSGCLLDGDLVRVEVDAEVCATDLALSFPGGYPIALSEQLTERSLGAALPESVALRVELVGMGIAAGEGVDTLGFIERLRIRAESPTGAVLPLEVIDAAAPATGDAWFLEPATRADLVPYLRDSALVFEVELAGDLPASDWSLSVDACFALRAAYGRGR